MTLLGSFAVIDRGGNQTWSLPTPPVAIARSYTDAQPIHNEESTDPKRDQAIGHSMQHARFHGSHSPACHRRRVN